MTKALLKVPYPVLALLLAALVLLGASLLSLPRLASSLGSGNPITGYAWSDTIGWISLNCSTDQNGCSSAAGNWGLATDVSGNVTGYAWSDDIGWIEFGGLSGFPSGTGTSPQNAQIVAGSLIGWARACAGTTPGDCSSMTSRTDGWDGWISLNGTNYGPTVNTCTLSGYAWGSDVVGWINFDYASTSSGTITDAYTCTNQVNGVYTTVVDTHTNASCNVSVTSATCPVNAFCVTGSATCQYPQTAPSGLGGTFKVDPAIVSSGATTTVSWITLNVQSSVANPQGCTVTGTNGDKFSGTLVGTISSGSYSSSPITQQTTYTIACTPLDPTQNFSEAPATVNVAPVFQEK